MILHCENPTGTNCQVPLSCKVVISFAIAYLQWGTINASEIDFEIEVVEIELTNARNEEDKPA